MAELGDWWRMTAVLALVVILGVNAAQADVLPVDQQPIDSIMYVDLADDLYSGDPYEFDGGHGFDGGYSRYPPGLPLLLVPFTLTGTETLFPVVSLVAFLLAVWVTAWRIGGPTAATVAVILMGTAPHLSRMGGFILSDFPAATAVVLGVLAWHERRPVLAGVLVGFSSVLRLANVAVVMAGAATLRQRFLRGAAPVMASLAAFWWVTRFGHRGTETGWGLSHIWSADGIGWNDEGSTAKANIVGIPQILLGVRDGVGRLMVPFVALIGFWELGRRRAWFPLSIIGSLVAIHMVYFVQNVRWMLPAAAILNVYVGVWVARRVATSDADQRRREPCLLTAEVDVERPARVLQRQ